MGKELLGSLELNRVHQMDCIEGMKQLPDNSIATCITDPPYNYEFIGKSWSAEESKRRTERIKDSKTLVKNIPYGSGLAGGVRNARWYKKNRDNIVEYQKWTEQYANELFRVMKHGGLVLIFNSTRTIAHVQIAMENAGFYTRDIMVYRRNSGIPKGLNVAKKLEKMGAENPKQWEGWHSALRNEWEAVLIVQKPLINNYIETLQKYNVGLFHAKTEEGFRSNIIEGIKREKKDEFNDHPTVKPLDLIKYLVEISTPMYDDNIVLDIFMGSGTTGVACKELGYNFLGFEREESYVQICNKRLNIS